MVGFGGLEREKERNQSGLLLLSLVDISWREKLLQWGFIAGVIFKD